jgi:hypothetical protein
MEKLWIIEHPQFAIVLMGDHVAEELLPEGGD